MTALRRKFSAIVLLFLAVAALSGRAQTYSVDVYTGSSEFSFDQNLYLDMSTLAGQGYKLWFVADINGNGVATNNVLPTGLISGDNKLILETFLDIGVNAAADGNFTAFGLQVLNQYSNAHIYVYLWNTTNAAEHGGDMFGVMDLGVHPPPTFGNPLWLISNAVYATQFTLLSYYTNIWATNTSGYWSEAGNWFSNPAVAPGSSTNYLLFGSTAAYKSTNDIGDFTLSLLEFTGTGDITLASSNNYKLVFTNEFGQPAIWHSGSGLVVIESGVNLASDISFDGSGGGTLFVSGVLSGAGGITKDGTFTLILSNANTFAGTAALNSGTTLIGNDLALGTNSLFLNGGTLAAANANARVLSNQTAISSDLTFGQTSGGTGSLTFLSPLTLSNGLRTLTISNSLTAFLGAVSSGGIIKAGTGTLVLSNSNTFSGGIRIDDGILKIGNNGALNSNLVEITSGTLRLDGRSPVVSGLFSTNALAVVDNGSASSSVLTVNTPVGGDYSYLGTLVNGGAGSLGLIKDGAGSLILSASNSYSGGTTVRAGRLQTDNTNGFGTGAITLNGGTLALHYDTNATFGPAGYNVTLGSNATVEIDHATDDDAINTYTLTLGGLVVGTNTFMLIGSNGYTLSVRAPPTLSNSTINALGGRLYFQSNATLAAQNTFGGSSRITLAGVTNTFSNNATLVSSTAGGLVVSNILLFNGLVTVSNSDSVIFDGRITNAAGTVAQLTKSGTGRLYLTNFGDTNMLKNTLSNLTINDGQVRVAATASVTNPLSVSPATNTIIVMNGGALEIRSDTSVYFGTNLGYTVTLNSNATLDVGFLTNASGARTISIGGINSFSNKTLTVSGDAGYTLQVNSGVALSNTTINVSSFSLTNLYRGMTSNLFSGDATFSGNGRVTFLGTNTLLAGVTVHASAAGGVLFSNIVLGGTNTFDTPLPLTVSGYVTQSVAGARLIKTGIGTMTIGTNAANTNNFFTGGTEIQGGTLAVVGRPNFWLPLGTNGVTLGAASFSLLGTNSMTFGTNGGYAVLVTNDAVISVDQALTGFTGGTLSLGTLTNSGNTIFVAGANSFRLGFNGVVGLSNSTLYVDTASLILNGPSNLFAGTVGFDGTNIVTITSNVMNGASSGSILRMGAGTLVLMASNAFTGGVEIDSGVIQISNSAALGPSVLKFSGGTLASANATAFTITNVVQMPGDASFGQSSGGTGDLTLTGPVDLTNGARTISVNNTNTTLSGIISNGAIIKAGTGTLIIPATNYANTFADGTDIKAGTVRLVGATGFQNGLGTNTITLGGGTLQLRADSDLSFGSGLGYTVTLTNNSTIDVGRIGADGGTGKYLSIATLNLDTNALTVVGASNYVLLINSNIVADTYTLNMGGVSTLSNAVLRFSGATSGIVQFNGPINPFDSFSTNIFTGGATVRLPGLTTISNAVVAATNTRVEFGTNTGVFNLLGNATFTGTNGLFTLFGGILISNQILTATNGTAVIFGNTAQIESNAAFFGGGNFTFAGPAVITNTIITASVSRVTFLTNVYLSGPTNVLGGTLNATSFQFNGPTAFSSNGALRVAGTGAVNFASVDFSGRLLFDATANGTVTVNGALNDTNTGGSLVKAGVNTLILVSSNNYLGGTIITNAGTLELRHTNAAGSNAITMYTGAILNLRSNVSANFGPTNNGYDVLALGTTATLSSGPVGAGSSNVLGLGTLYLGAGINLTNNTTSNYFTAINGPVTMASNATITANGNLVLNGVVLTTNRQLLTKAGAGILFFNTNAAPTVLLSNTGGAFQWNYTLADANPTNVGFDTNSIILNGGAFRWAPTNALTANQGATLTNPFLVLSGGGQLLASERTTAGNAPNAVFTGIITNQGTLLVGSFDNGETNPALNIQYNGTLIVDQVSFNAPALANATLATIGTSRGLTYVKAINSAQFYDANYNGNIVDGGTNTLFRNPLVLNGGSNFFGTLNINGAANTYAGGTIVNGINNGGIVNVTSTSSLGLGDVTINPGGRLRLNSLANIAAGRTVFVQPGGVLGVGANIDPTSLVNGGSTGVIAIDTTSYSVSLDLATIGNGRMILGSTITNGVYQAATLGAGSDGIYRLGGGGGTLTLTNTANLLTGTNSLVLGAYSNRVAVGNLMTDAVYNATLRSTAFATNGSGNIILGQANDYSGITVVNSGTNVATAANALGTNSVLINGGSLIIAATNAYTGTNGIPVVPAGGQLVTLINGEAKPFGNSNVMVHVYGTLAVAGAQGTLLNETNIFLHPGSVLALDSFTAGLNTNRLNDTTALLLNGGTLLFAGQAANGVFTTETNGMLTVTGGSAIQLNGVNNAGASTILTLSNIVRSSNGTLRISPSSTGAFDLGTSNRIFLTTAPTITSNILAPWMVNTSSNTFLFYSNTVGLTNAIYATTNLVSAASNLVVNAANPIPLLGTNKDVYALRLAGNIGSLTNVITNRSGGLIIAANAAIGPRLVFQNLTTPVEALIFVGSGVTGTITNSISAAGITKFGLGTLQFNTTSNNAYASGWNINEGTVLLNNSNALGQSLPGNFVNLNGNSTLIFSNATAYSNTLFTSGKITLLDYGNALRLASQIADATNTIANVDLNSLVPGQGSTATLVVGNSRNQFTIPVLTLNDHATLVLSNAQVASGSLGNIGVTNLAATNKSLTLLGGAQLYLLGDNRATFVSNNVFVSGGSLAFTTTNAFGSNSIFTIGSDAVLDLRAAVSNFTGGSSQVRQLAGSAERWSHLYSRFLDATTAETITLSNGVGLQLNVDLIGLTNKTVNLTGGVLEPFAYSDGVAGGTARTNALGVTINLSSDSFVGRSTADPTTSTTTNLAIESLITGAGKLTKIGANTVFIRVAESNNTFAGGTDIKGGILQVEIRTNLAGSVVATNPLSTGLITLGGGQLNIVADTNAAFTSAVLGNSILVTNMSGLDVSRNGAAALPNLFVTFGGLTNLGQVLTMSAGSTTNSVVFTGPTLLSNATLNLTRNTSTQYFNSTFTLLGNSVFTGDKARTVVGGLTFLGTNANIYSTLSGAVDLNSGITLNGTNLLRATGTWNISGALNEVLAGSQLIKDGPGALNITNNVISGTPFSGGVIVNAGSVTAAGSDTMNLPLGTGPLIFNGGALTLRADTNVTFGGGSGQSLTITTNLALAVSQITFNGGFGKILTVGDLVTGTNAVTGSNNILTVTSTSNYVFGINGTLNGVTVFDGYNSTTNFAGTGIVQFNAAQLFTNTNSFGAGLTFRFSNTNDFGSNTVLLVTNTGGLVFINSNYIHGPFTVSNTTSVIFNGPLLDGSPGQLIKSGAGTLFLTNLVNSSYSGGTVLGQGTITAAAAIGATNPLGTGPILLNAGTLNLRSDTNLTFGPNPGYAITAPSNATINIDRLTAAGGNNLFTIGDLQTASNSVVTVTPANGTQLAVADNVLGPGENRVVSGLLVYSNQVSFAGTNWVGGLWVYTNAAAGFLLNGSPTLSVPSGQTFAPNDYLTNGSASTVLTKSGLGTITFSNNNSFGGSAANGQPYGMIIEAGTAAVMSNSFASGFGTNANILLLGTPGILGVANQPTLQARFDANLTLGSSAAPGGYNVTVQGGNATFNVDRLSGGNFGMSISNLTVSNAVLTFGGANHWVDIKGTNTIFGTAVFRPINGRTITNSGPIVAGAPGAIFVKQGANDFLYTNSVSPNHTGGTFIQQAGLRWRPIGLSTGNLSFGTGPIYIDNGAVFDLGNNVNGGMTLSNDIYIGNYDLSSGGIRTYDVGRLEISSQNNAESLVTNLGNVYLRGNLYLASVGGDGFGTNTQPLRLRNLVFDGKDVSIFTEGNPGGTGARQVIDSLSTVGSPRNLTIIPNRNGLLEVFGGSNYLNFNGDFYVKQAFDANNGNANTGNGIVRFASTNALPSGFVHVEAGAGVGLMFNPQTNFGGLAGLNNRFDFAPGSLLTFDVITGGWNMTNLVLDLSASGMNRDIRIGVGSGYSTTFTNNIIPFASTYRLGGGGGTMNLSRTNQLTGANTLLAGPNPYGNEMEYVRIGSVSAGTLVINSANSNYSGNIVIQSGQLTYNASNALGTGRIDVYGTLFQNNADLGYIGPGGQTNFNAMVFHPGSTLRIDLRAGANSNRFGDAETLALNGTVLDFIGDDAAGATRLEFITNLTFAGGSRIQFNNQHLQNTNLLLVSNLVRAGFGTLSLDPVGANGSGTMGHTNRLVILDPSSLMTSNNVMVKPFIVSTNANTFLTYSNGLGLANIIGFTNFNNYAADTVLTNGSTQDTVVDMGSATNVVISNLVAHAIRMGNNAAIRGNAGTTLTNVSGGFLIRSGSTATNSIDLFAGSPDGTFTNEMTVFVGTSGTFVLTTTNLRASTVTKFGPGALTLNGNLTNSLSNYNNGWNINQGTVNVGADFGLGASNANNLVTLNGGVTLNFNRSAAGNTYASGRIINNDINTISVDTGGDDRTQTFGVLGLDMNSISNGQLGSVLTLSMNRSRQTARILGPVTLNADSVFQVRNTGAANVSTGSTNRFESVGGIVGTNRTLLKMGNGILQLTGDSSSTWTNGTIWVNAGTLAVAHNGALGGTTNSVTRFRDGTVLELASTLTNFNPLSSLDQQAGSAERWNGQFNRFSNDLTTQTNVIGTNVHLQVAVNLLGLTNKTIVLNGGTIEGYQYIDTASTVPFGIQISTNVTLQLAMDSKIGVSGVDIGRAMVFSNVNFLTNNFVFSNYARITGAGSLTKIGIDTVELGGVSNDWAGGTIINEGILRNGINNALPVGGLLTVSNFGTYELNGFSQTVRGLNGAGHVINTLLGAPQFTVEGADDSIFSGSLDGDITLVKGGSGTFTLSGASNGYTGATIIRGGTLVASTSSLNGQAGSLGSGSSAILLGDTNGTSDAAFLVSSNVTIGRAVTVQSGSSGLATLGGAFGSGSSSFTNIITLNKDAVLTAASGGSVNFNGPIGGSGGITKSGGGTVTLNAANSYGGGTIVTGGILQNGVNNALPTSTPLSVTNPGVYNLNGFNQTVGALSGTGTVTNTGANSTFAVGGGSSTVFSGGIHGNLNFAQTGTGALTLISTNSFTGSTLISAGTIELGAPGALAGTSGITITNGGTLLLSGAAGNRIKDTAPMTLGGGTFNTGGLSETLGTLTLSANSTIDLGSGASVLAFANSSGSAWAGGSVLVIITNWSGQWNIGGGTDQLLFGNTSSGLTAGQVSEIKFQIGGMLWDAQILGTGEIVPVPEPATWLATASVLGLLGFRERRRITDAVRRLANRG